MRRSSLRVASLAALALALFIAGLLWLGRSETQAPLSILQGVKPNEVRREDPTGRFSRAIYFLNVPYEEVVAAAQRDLGGKDWFDNGRGVMGVHWFCQRPGPLQAHGQQIDIRANRCDPDTFEVLGKAADSRTWTTVVVLGGKRDANPFRAIWRWATRAP